MFYSVTQKGKTLLIFYGILKLVSLHRVFSKIRCSVTSSFVTRVRVRVERDYPKTILLYQNLESDLFVTPSQNRFLFLVLTQKRDLEEQEIYYS